MQHSFFKTFSRSQVSSLVATAVDFGLLFVLVEALHVWYVAAVAAGCVAGAVTNFYMNRHWSFSASHEKWHGQAIRYAVTSGISMLLNSGGVYVMTEYGGVHYFGSVLVISAVVGVFFNFPMQRHFVFR